MSQLIMIIDDEAGMRDLLGDALKLAGFETVTAADAMIAQTLLRSTKPDLLIVDINMPLMDGFEFIERIRSNGDNTPALMLSARGDRADITKGLTLGADDYVTKPFGLEELVLRIKAILRRSQFTVETATNLSSGPITLNSDTHQVTFFGFTSNCALVITVTVEHCGSTKGSFNTNHITDFCRTLFKASISCINWSNFST